MYTLDADDPAGLNMGDTLRIANLIRRRDRVTFARVDVNTVEMRALEPDEAFDGVCYVIDRSPDGSGTTLTRCA